MSSCSYWQTEQQLNKDQLKLKLQLQLILEKKVKKTFILLPDKSVIMYYYYDNNIIATPKVWLTTARGAQHVTLDFCGLVLQVQCNKVNFPVG
jgi:hypothetical protein